MALGMLTPAQRETVNAAVEIGGYSPSAVARARGVSPPTAHQCLNLPKVREEIEQRLEKRTDSAQREILRFRALIAKIARHAEQIDTTQLHQAEVAGWLKVALDAEKALVDRYGEPEHPQSHELRRYRLQRAAAYRLGRIHGAMNEAPRWDGRDVPRGTPAARMRRTPTNNQLSTCQVLTGEEDSEVTSDTICYGSNQVDSPTEAPSPPGIPPTDRHE